MPVRPPISRHLSYNTSLGSDHIYEDERRGRTGTPVTTIADCRAYKRLLGWDANAEGWPKEVTSVQDCRSKLNHFIL